MGREAWCLQSVDCAFRRDCRTENRTGKDTECAHQGRGAGLHNLSGGYKKTSFN